MSLYYFDSYKTQPTSGRHGPKVPEEKLGVSAILGNTLDLSRDLGLRAGVRHQLRSLWQPQWKV